MFIDNGIIWVSHKKVMGGEGEKKSCNAQIRKTNVKDDSSKATFLIMMVNHCGFLLLS